ncbi:MAG TPA: Ig-like domain-containing protein, partial [Gemmatimonadales bacterium]
MLVLGLVVGACSSDPTAAGIIVSVTIAPRRDTLAVGETSLRLSAVAKNAGGDTVSTATIIWKSDQPFLASVDSLTGAVKGLAIGAAAITAQVGPVVDTAQVFVVSPVSVSLGLDTILLAPGDTFTIPADAGSRTGPAPTLTYGGGSAAIATVNPQSGLVTAVASGVTAYQVHADTFVAAGVVEVLALADTASDGSLSMTLTGAVTRRVMLAARGFNYPTLDNTLAFQLAAVNPDTTEDHLTMLLQNTVNATQTRAIGVLPSNVSDPVCHPPGTWAFYRQGSTAIRASSQSGT